MPEIDDERAEVINYGLQNIVGEIPKIFLLFKGMGITEKNFNDIRSIIYVYCINTL